MLKIAICDDSENQVKMLHKQVMEFITENHELAEVVLYTQSRLLQYDIQEGSYFDLILSDIEMPNVDGMELVSHIRKFLPESIVIFITSHLKYSVDAFELSIFRYIPKDCIETRLPKALEDAFRMMHLQSERFFTIETSHRMERIPWKKMVYIQRDGKNSVFYLMDGSVTKVRKSLSQVYSELDETDFVYIDKGIIINLSHIMSIKDGIIEMEDGNIVTCSNARLKQLKKELQKYWSKNI